MHPTTFLELCQRTAEECFAGGAGLTTVVNQTGEYGRIVNRVRTAWLEIQNMHDNWDFHWQAPTFTTTEDQSAYTIPISNNNIRELVDPIMIHDGNLATESKLTFEAWDSFNGRRNLGVVTKGRPTIYTRRPDESIALYPTPDATVYTITLNSYREAQLLAADGDTPLCPARHNMVIVWKAAELHAIAEEDPNLLGLVRQPLNESMINLKNDQLPKQVIALRPLA